MSDRSCLVPKCPYPYHCKGYCQPHYMRVWRYDDPQAWRPIRPRVYATEDNFWARVDKNGPSIKTRPDLGPCWLWTGRLEIGGYGLFGYRNGVAQRVHRTAWEQANGHPVPADKELDHLCHTFDLDCRGGTGDLHRRCLNPRHLEPVTHRENTMRGVTGRMETCSAGHPLVVVGYSRNGHPRRDCLECRTARRLALRDEIVVDPGVRRAPVKMTDCLLREVADTYRAAAAVGESPRLAVARHFGRSPATISDWLRNARAAGILAPA